jgi:CheY-like chemotaxis protein
MNALPQLDTVASRGLFGALRAWLRARSRELCESPDPLADGLERHNARYGNAVRVLVVDDNPVNLLLMATLIESRGLIVLVAADGAEAVALACELHFNLILMDVQMPVLNGYEATLAIRRFECSHLRPAVPVIAYSSAVTGDEVLAAHGMNGSLPKPCEDQDLEDCLIQWCPTYRSARAALSAAHHKVRPQSQRPWCAHSFPSLQAPQEQAGSTRQAGTVGTQLSSEVY